MRPCETDGHVYILQLSECYCEDEGCSECFNNQAANYFNYFTRFGAWPAKTFTGPVYVCGDPGVRCEDCTFTGLLPNDDTWPPTDWIEVTVWPPGHTGNPSDEHWRLYDHDASQSYYSPSAMECYLPGDYLTAGGAASDWLGEELG